MMQPTLPWYTPLLLLVAVGSLVASFIRWEILGMTGWAVALILMIFEVKRGW